jgi:multiple antibiotic resistance protein
MIAEAALATFTMALFSMMNPIGSVGIFAAMTANRPEAEARRIALTCAIAIAITLIIVTWSGSLLLNFFGITIHSLRAAGGVIVLLIGLQMLFNKSAHKHSTAEMEDAESKESIAVVPLAIPMVAGPGTMATVLVGAQQNSSVLSKVEISVVILVLAVLCGILFNFSAPIANRLGSLGWALSRVLWV